MKSIIAIIITSLCLTLPETASAQSDGDREAVRQVMQNFIRAFETGDGDLVRQAFRSDGVLVGYSTSTGAVKVERADGWTKNFTGEPPADEAQRKRDFVILDVTDTGAVSKVTLDYPTWQGVDYIALQKIDGVWKIVSKSWSGKSKAVRPK